MRLRSGLLPDRYRDKKVCQLIISLHFRCTASLYGHLEPIPWLALQVLPNTIGRTGQPWWLETWLEEANELEADDKRCYGAL
jgi:hypothetical protein